MNDAEGPEPPRGASSFRRATQYLAIPLADFAPSHRAVSPWIRTWWRNSTALLTSGALLCAATGVLISTAPRTVPVYADASHAYLGTVALTRETESPVPGYTMYGGAAVILLSSASATARSAGSAMLSGVRASGGCTQVAGHSAALTERCAFSVGSARITSLDSFDPGTRVWRRTYSDGESAQFVVPSGQTVIPIPLPLAH
ncbi:MAG: hypothetical protein JOZ75_13820 [Candidatus Dormibacteraeota bacterium]|nr:hypothetical protein [Candidatus Dormibacteraeota bacterium]